jgi:hypothetical protein
MRRPFHPSLWLALLICAVVCAMPARAALVQVTIRTTRAVLLADGKQQAQILAEVRDSNGRTINGAEVQFQLIGGGSLSETRVESFGGTAQTQLTSASIAGVAHLTATATVAGGGVGVSNVLDIIYTDDPDETFLGNSYVQVTGPAYLAYSATVTDRIIEAQGKNGGARLTYRNYEITADRLQLKCDQNNIIRATNNVTLKRGKDVIHAIRLYYSLTQAEGYAIAENNGKLEPVHLTHDRLKMEPPVGHIPDSYFTLPEIESKLVVVARSINYFPGEKLQFKHAKFFQDGLQIMSLPYYELSLTSDELFSDHFISVGSNGLGLQIPYYYSLSPSESGIVYLRHQDQLGRSYFSQESGFAVDVLQSYNSVGDHRSEGAYGFTDLLHDDWGFRWSHTQEFSPTTQGNFYLDFPDHDSTFASANLTKNYKLFRIGMDASGGDSFVDGSRSTRASLYAETQPRPLFGSKLLNFTVGTHFTSEHDANPTTTTTTTSTLTTTQQAVQQGIPLPLSTAISETSQDATIRAFTHQLHLDLRTTMSASFTFGHVWSKADASGQEGIGELALNRSMGGGATLGLNYSYRSEPTGLTGAEGKHLVSLNYGVAISKRLQFTLYGSSYLDIVSTSLLSDLAYRINTDWRLLTATTFQTYSGVNYTDLELTLGRRIGSRELQLTYSTYLHRISFDLTATRW